MLKALVTGVAGQDGSYLAELLLSKGYEVNGIVRRYSVPSFPNIEHLLEKDAIVLHEADLLDQASIEGVVQAVHPDEVYNLAAQSHVGSSFVQPEYTHQATGLGAVRVFEAVRRHARGARVYQASSSEMMGNMQRDLGIAKADENGPFRPVSPYGIAKLDAHHAARMYRESHGMHVSCGILFNHESSRRGTQFVTRKITLGLARIAYGIQDKLELGNLSAVRDWGHANEYVEAMWRMLQAEVPGDFVVATGVGANVASFLDVAAHEVARESGTSVERLLSKVSSVASEKRPTDIDILIGNADKANRELGWNPTLTFEGVARMMAKSDCEAIKAAKAVTA